MPPLYNSRVYDRNLPIGSYWETTVASEPSLVTPLLAAETCDVAIIGGGITGLATALHLARDYGIQPVVLEAGYPAWGASGRNGGFCCIGSTRLSHDALLQRFGRSETQRYFQVQHEAVDLVRQIAEAEAIAIDAQGSGEIVVAHRASRWSELEAEYQFLTTVADYPCQLWSAQQVRDYAFSSPEVHGALHVGVGFGLNPMKYSLGLAQACNVRGVSIYGKSPVEAWEKDGCWHVLHTPGGTLRAKIVVIATNGYTEDELHGGLAGCFLPTLSNIITTRPLTDAELEAQGWHTETPIYDTRNLLYYFRLLNDKRVLFGSRGGTVGNQAEGDRRQRAMTEALRRMFPAWETVDITHYWNGLVCISAALTPHIGQMTGDPTVFYGLAYHGNGVAMGSWSGRAVARLVAGRELMHNLCAVFRQSLQRFPLPAFRIWYLRSMYTLYKAQDRL